MCQAHLQLVQADVGEEGLQGVGAALVLDAQQLRQGPGQLVLLLLPLWLHLHAHPHVLPAQPPAATLEVFVPDSLYVLGAFNSPTAAPS